MAVNQIAWFGRAIGFGLAFPVEMLIGLFFILSGVPTWAMSPEPVDVAIVLAVDVSTSVSGSEYEQQKRGIVAALRDPEVGRVLEQCNANGVALTFLEWAGSDFLTIIHHRINWRKLSSAVDLHRFADTIEAERQRVAAGATDIINALRFSSRLLLTAPFESRRKIISISGDGGQNVTPPGEKDYRDKEHVKMLRSERDQVLASGIVIDALVIPNDEEESRRIGPLDQYFQNNVVGGRGANLRVVRDFADYANGLKANLLGELDNCAF